MIITLWYRFSKKAEGMVFNHISNGFLFSQLVPSPINEHQHKSWESAIWISERAKLIDNVVRMA